MSLQSLDFIVIFLPLALILHILLNKTGYVLLGQAWLIGASLLFAGLRTLSDVELLLLSIALNFCIGWFLHRQASATNSSRKALLAAGVVMNLAVLGYFKYSAFVLDNIGAVMQSAVPSTTEYLPLGISFLTFQQVAYLVDVYRGQVKTFNFMQYCVFCSFFPKLLAGPIVRYGEFVPQITDRAHTCSPGSLAEGITQFAIGLFKKVVLADSLASYADPVFAAGSQDVGLGMVEAWGGVLAYSFQLYFDFSGYTDMALGAARMFGLTLPQNFDSPYKAADIIDFWRRWHMTLSRFLRDYLYIPLGGNRKGLLRQQFNVMITMVLCGLWHGAGWTFVIWGALHGLYLMINHGWRRLGVNCPRPFGWLLTFGSVSFAWVWFRSDSLSAAARISASLFGSNGLWADGLRNALHQMEKPAPQFQSFAEFFLSEQLRIVVSFDKWTVYPVTVLLSEPVLHTIWLLAAALIVFRLPNTGEWTDTAAHNPETLFAVRRAAFVGVLLFLTLLASMTSHPGKFIYQSF
ncbi:MAG: putative poly(beta-D-mannuronate) O-acetylase [Nitrospira sp.]|jgi:D-alanyl-lipoteichoic acid acyltransferase DltB (MBOAT superfamily)|nr:MAG: putative poly(beta-D-mannuronate) O-acetylase [Nitrospira sp.]